MLGDKLKWAFAALIFGSAFVAGQYVPEDYMALKYIGLLCAFFVALFLVYGTELIQRYRANLTLAWVELLKVTWPTKDEAIKTSIMVSIVVCIFAVIMWLLDAGLTKIVAAVIAS